MMMQSMNKSSDVILEYGESTKEHPFIEYDDAASLDEMLDEIAEQEAEINSELDFGIWAP